MSFHQVMARAGIEIEFVKLLQLADAPERSGAERSFAVEGMQHDAFEQIPEREVVVLRKGLEDL